ncbi:MAG TPA: TetR/AcrR family transcriptional regulator, partial [Stenotrophobium sp.]|jgi:TetR/AcrR family transcriptional repressor of mexJK operon|nr:TetR/AcrR family transcriptional regulator [Stenotrophobium sp.]
MATVKPTQRSATSRARGRPKDLDKRAAIMASAKQLFARHGYSGVSMDAIAAHARVSKLTLYSHFKSKAALFQTAVAEKCRDFTPPDFFDPDSPLPLRERLRIIGHGFMSLVMNDETLEFYRLLCAQGASGSRLGKLFFAAGPARNLSQMSGLLERADAAGELRIADSADAAGHFFSLLQGIPHMKVLIGEGPRPTARQLRAHVHAVVDLFMRAYARET